jgi:hypothetical protein
MPRYASTCGQTCLNAEATDNFESAEHAVQLSFGGLPVRTACLRGEVDSFGVTTSEALRAAVADLQAAQTFGDLPFGTNVVDVQRGSVTVEIDPEAELLGALLLRPGQPAPASPFGWGIARRIRIDEIRPKEDR